MKKKLILLFTLILCLCATFLVACGDGGSTNSGNTGGGGENNSPSLNNITGVVFEDATFDYDGQEKTITINEVSLPEGVTVTYTNNKGTNAGVYNAKAVLTGEGYNTLTLNAKLTINKINYDTSNTKWNYLSPYTYDGSSKSVEVSGLPDGVTVKQYTDNEKINAGSYTAKVTFNYDTVNYNAPVVANCSWTIEKATMSGITLEGDTSVEYDTLEHSLYIVGNTPAGATVTYTYNGQAVEGVSAVGSYTVVAKVVCPNYNDLVLTKTLNITSTEVMLYSINNNGSIYFQNNLDDNKLYRVSGANVVKVNNDKPEYMISDGTSVFYYSSSLLNSSIKQLNGNFANVLYQTKGEYLTTDGTYLYYAVNNLLMNTDQNGIYKLKLDNNGELPVRICTEKAKFLTYYNDTIYYANASENNKLYKVSTMSTDAKGTLVHDEKVEYIIQDNGVLYFNSSKTIAGVVGIASAIYKYTISSDTLIKLTTDNGKYLTKVGSYIYYVNNDKLTSTIFGDGIYRVSVNKNSDSSLPGSKILSIENNGFSSLTSDGTSLYYYKLNDKHFYKNDISGESEVDLMKNFVVQEPAVSLSGFAKLAEYNGEIYYTNLVDNGALYKYNPTTKAKIRVLEDTVSNVYFYKGYMYYSTYILTNFALWRMDLQTNVSTKISSDRCDNLIFVEDTIYYIKTGSAYNNHIHSMGLDGSNPIMLFDTTLWISDFYYENGKLYCAANAGLLGKNDKLYIYDIASASASECSFETEAFTVYNGIVYYYDHNDNTINSYNGSSTSVLVSNVTVNDLIIHNGKLYYSSTKGSIGLFALDLSTKTSTKISSNNADGLLSYNNCLYFLQTAISYTSDYPSSVGVSSNDGHLYCYDGTSVKKVA